MPPTAETGLARRSRSCGARLCRRCRSRSMPQRRRARRPSPASLRSHGFYGRVEVIPGAALGADERGLVGALLDLASQPEDLHVDRAVVDVVVEAAGLEQLVAAEDAVGGAKERDEQRVFAVGELDGTSVGRPQPARARVELPAGELVRAYRLAAARGALALGAAQDRLDAREELALAEGLGDVVVGAQLQAHDAVGLLLAPGEDDDRQVERFAQPPRDREAGRVGQL